MGNELHADYTGAGTIYARAWKVATGEIADWDNEAWVAFVAGNIGNYDLPLAEVTAGSGFYAADMPAWIAVGTRLHITYHEQAGVGPAVDDVRFDAHTATWRGELGAEEIGAGDYITTAERAQRASDVLNGLAAARLTDLLAWATDYLESATHRTLIQAAVTETRNGDGSRQMILDQFPVDSLTTITITDSEGTTYDIASDQFRFEAETGIVEFKPDVDADYTYFPVGFQNVEIVYPAGYDPIPDDLQEAAIELMEIVASGIEPGVQQERLGDYAVTFRTAAEQLSATTKATIRRYRDLKMG